MDVKVSYETLFDILRREKQREEIQELPSTFILDVNAYLHDKEELLKHPFSKEHDHVRTQIANTKKILKELMERRENKIIRIAQDKARGSMVNSGILLPQEQHFFLQASTIISSQRKQVFDDLFLESTEHTPSFPEKKQSLTPERTPLASLQSPQESNVVLPRESNGSPLLLLSSETPLKSASQLRDSALKSASLQKTVRILQPLPKFAGKNLEVYGPFQTNDTPSLPEQIANILIKKGRAEEA